MPASSGFLEYVADLFGDLGPIRTRHMFGGAGVYLDDVMFAVVIDDVLYLKTDRSLAAELKRMGSREWTYRKADTGAVVSMGYWSLPARAADDSEEALLLAQKAYRIARASKKPPRGKAVR
jgi:DNA transformation protein and related proteins